MFNLYFIFLKIGLLAFGGGYVIIPLIETYLISEGYLNSKILIDIISISQVTPGPIAINAATFIGMQKYGFLGMILATIGVISPQIIILNIFYNFLNKENKTFKKILNAIKASTLGLIIVVSIGIFKDSILKNNKINYIALFCFFITLIMEKFKVKNVYKIIICIIISYLINLII